MGGLWSRNPRHCLPCLNDIFRLQQFSRNTSYPVIGGPESSADHINLEYHVSDHRICAGRVDKVDNERLEMGNRNH